jgi:hypothetical protein
LEVYGQKYVKIKLLRLQELFYAFNKNENVTPMNPKRRERVRRRSVVHSFVKPDLMS